MPNVMISPTLDMDISSFSYKVEVLIDDPALKSVFKLEEEQYELEINTSEARIRAITYVGFVRGLETFMQAITCPRHKVKNCSFKNLPMSIKDQPFLEYRGIMIDSSRHFLPTKLIYETIDAMMYNKLNILHWHLVD